MTGSELKRLREKLGLDAFQFSVLLGVHRSSIYRWESSDSPKIDPLQRELLLSLQEQKISKAIGADLGRKIRAGLIEGGTLGGLYVLLTFLMKETTLHG